MATAKAKSASSVEDVRKLALPLGTNIAAADGALKETVSWALRIAADEALTARAPSPNDLLLVEAGEDGESRVDEGFIRWASEHGVSAIIGAAAPAPAAIAAANRSELPLLTLPADGARANLRDIQRDILTLIVDRRGQLARRSTQVFRQLTQISSHNAGPAPLLEALALLTGKTVVLQDKRLDIAHISLQPALIGQWEALERALREPATLPAVYQDRLRIPPQAMPAQRQLLPVAGSERIIAPIVTHGVGRGFLSLLGKARRTGRAG